MVAALGLLLTAGVAAAALPPARPPAAPEMTTHTTGMLSEAQLEAAERTAHRPEGVPSSWPRSLQCQNVTYRGPYRHYSHVIGVAEGRHTLWTGVYIDNATPNIVGWVGGWIEIGGVLDPLFPAPFDDRPQRFPGARMFAEPPPSPPLRFCPRSRRSRTAPTRE
eukprot:COSAG04_NODE_7683_length_1087_cov_2.543522_1_plen_163_part_10